MGGTERGEEGERHRRVTRIRFPHAVASAAWVPIIFADSELRSERRKIIGSTEGNKARKRVINGAKEGSGGAGGVGVLMQVSSFLVRRLIPPLSSSPGENLLTMLALTRHEPDSRTNAAAINSRAPQGRPRRQGRKGTARINRGRQTPRGVRL